ncbi:winged helix-turn-helix domain-containing protein [Bacillus cereus]|uniref:winged helix-turn-helix domain-containing protein n=1 Tax=Bacillus cereus TaxID=1396 RepID=UPI003C2E839B
MLYFKPRASIYKNTALPKCGDDNYIEDDNTVMVHIRKLRKKIEIDPSNPKFIQTIWGIGYKFVGEKLED